MNVTLTIPNINEADLLALEHWLDGRLGDDAFTVSVDDE